MNPDLNVNKPTNQRQSQIRDNHLHEVAVAAGLGPVKEARFLIPGEDSRPADIYLPQFAAGLDAAIDVTVVNPLQQATVAGAATTAGHAITSPESRTQIFR